MNKIIIKARTNNLFDVFFGKEGWNDWACFKRERNRLLLIKGSPVPNALYAEISQQLINR